MRKVKLHFIDDSHLTALLNDINFQNDINYLNPNKIDKNNIVLSDPITYHAALDTEIVVLSKFAHAIKNIIFPMTNYNIDFLNPCANEQKRGLRHGNTVIIDSIDLEIARINIIVESV